MIERTGQHTYRWRAMASPVELQLPGVGEAEGLRIAQAVAAEFEATEQALSRFRPTSELVALNQRLGRRQIVSSRLYRALSAAWRAERMTRGLFSPLVLEALEAIGYVGAPHAKSTSQSRAWLLRWPRVRAVCLHAPVDLGGIGKGLAVRWGARLVARQTENFLLNAGGDLIASGPGPARQGWQVGVEDPLEPDHLIAVLQMPRRGAACTSSVARLRWRQGARVVHHLIDPRTGAPGGRGILAVTVLARDPAWAEVASKVLFLAGGEGIRRQAQGKIALWVTEDGRLHWTDEAEPFLIWTRPYGLRSHPDGEVR